MADFASEYGIRLHAAADMTWAEFRDLLAGLLLQTNTRTWRHFTKDDEEADGDV